ncbi:exopolysaccharide biosynthesis polyprenyl glycosylphosphotransferase [Meridianimarinicoccus aquatilis]|uniref:Exopolysaccharide biosynthesis polyprenyl glycosylphosphotransferase n=1 Tax=Meridianimarinicoccus aquatilis TaxID=2552766 RepID=A0A4R6AYZ1_9RHOB|nr:exopolysaccharide biosynthesis polyprenyl glycosylphosphotransferase [Fluviibacterium aquatile]TDL88984.1 exopolysaccharide biosynthesis polyprenyl glycosylphosphotransferase [Fluviibacterium aquatile]
MTEAARIVAWRLRRPSLAPVRIALLAALAEGCGLFLASWFAQFSAVQGFSGWSGVMWSVMFVGWAVPLSASFSGYRLDRLLKPGQGGLPAAGAVCGAALVVEFVGGPGLVIVAGSLPAMIALRFGLAPAAGWAVEQGLTERRAVLVGGGEGAARLIRGLAERADNDIRICGIFDDRAGDRSPDAVLDVPKIGRFDDLVVFCRQAEIDMIIMTLPPEAETRIAALLTQFKVLPVPVHLSAFSRDYRFEDGPDGLSALLPASFRPERRLLKRAFDLSIASLLLVVLAPVLAIVAVLIRLDSPGPVFFRQVRHGFNDRPIRVWKFRSMYHDQADAAAMRVVVRGDPRVTRVGKFLRKSSLDELPQLFNVFGGTLSLVGPRPHAVAAQSSRQEAFDRIVDGYSARHRLPPGITGWAQVNGWRGEVDDPESLRARFAHDLFYIENWSLWFDLAILVRTPISLFDTRRAY